MTTGNGRYPSGAARREMLDASQSIADNEQSAAETDQTAADADQTSADQDQLTSDSDRASSEADQKAADSDQATADREARGGDDGAADEEAHHDRDRTRAQRAQVSADRARAATQRARTTVERFGAAEARDEAARSRDLACVARDLAAAARDRLITEAEGGGEGDDTRAAARRRAAVDRERAAQDRRRAADDRECARIDREQFHLALAESHFDDLTGTYRRGMGSHALQGELDRARRADGRLTLAFVDVDGLKVHNDIHGHAAGDELLVDVVTCIRSHLRSYDPIVRFGGDEFVCALAHAEVTNARARFKKISAALKKMQPDASISVGFAALREEDTLEDLLARGDEALYLARRPPEPSLPG